MIRATLRTWTKTDPLWRWKLAAVLPGYALFAAVVLFGSVVL